MSAEWRLVPLWSVARWQLALDVLDWPGVVRWLTPLLLATLALGLIASHVVAWRRAQRQQLPATELEFRRKQFRRRVQASGMLALAAAAVGLGQWIPWRERPSLYVAFWFGTGVLLLWVVALALGDAWASSIHFRRLWDERHVARAELQAELERLRAKQNGRASSRPNDPNP